MPSNLLTKLNILLSFFLKLALSSPSAKQPELKAAVPLKWFIFREDCFNAFFTQMDFTNVECIKFTIMKVLGYLIIAGAFIIKVPQILKIMKNKSVAGISKFLFYIEVRKLAG